MTTIDEAKQEYGKSFFLCPFCKEYSHFHWEYYINGIGIATCSKCGKTLFWLNDGYTNKMIYPQKIDVSFPYENMTDDVKNYYFQAREVVNDSPKAAAAFLRLAFQKLLKKEKKSDFSDFIKKVLTTLRVIGSNSIQPGLIDDFDNEETAKSLFNLINSITEEYF